jgi:hypothetical protein
MVLKKNVKTRICLQKLARFATERRAAVQHGAALCRSSGWFQGGRNGQISRCASQLGGGFFLTDGGIEATLIFPEGPELKDFAAFDLLGRPGGKEALRKYFRTYAEMATRFGPGRRAP